MKKAIKFIMFLIVLALTMSMLTMVAFADTTCESDEVNIAGNATVIGDRGPGTELGDVFWSVSDHYTNVIDGDPKTVCPIDTTHWKNYGLWITLDDTYDLTKLVVQTSGVGRAQTSYGVSNIVSSRSGAGFEVQISLYDVNGAEIYSTSATAKQENIVINLEAINIEKRTYKIYIYFVMNNNAQGIWEVEAYTKEAHKWEEQNVIRDTTCFEIGLKTVKCADCRVEKETIIPIIAHTDTCKGSCDRCGAILEINHEGANGCASTECAKCGEIMTAVSHTKSTTDPCSTACTVCEFENVFTPVHVPDGTNPCNNDCVKCGAKDVIPNAYDIPQIYSTGTYPPYTYAKHVANPYDPCDTTCYDCGDKNAVKAAHVPDPDNPCTVSKCYKCKEDGVFTTIVRGTTDPYPHVRPEKGAVTLGNGTSTYSCRIYCAECYKINVIPYAHEFTDCGDSTCDICGNTVSLDERDHKYTADSPTKCVDCGHQRPGYVVACDEHVYDNVCDTICNICKVSKYVEYGYPRDTIPEIWHIYENSCDINCNDCAAVRTIEHTYPEYKCAELCTICGERRITTASHTYSDINSMPNSSACDQSCDVCLEIRSVPHNYTIPCASNCSICGATNANAEKLHNWTDSCDETCDNAGCTKTREAGHEYDNDCDTTCNNESCTTGTREITHRYTSVCDTECDVVGCTTGTRTVPPHKYTNACDATCNQVNCNYTRTVETDSTFDPDHDYDHGCDVICNICGLIRTVPAHAYDNDCDDTCNTCNVKMRTTSHTFGEWITTKEADKGVEGEQERTCACGYSEKRAIPALEKGGLGVGAIIAIVVGSVGVLGGGGFSLWWFVLKKKFAGK